MKLLEFFNGFAVRGVLDAANRIPVYILNAFFILST